VDPKDALHVATAIDARLELLNTFDRPLLSKNGQLGNPSLRIEIPSWEAPKLPLRSLMGKQTGSDQSQRFIEKARELGCDEDPKAFERTFSKIVPPKKPAPPKSKMKKPRRG